MQAVVDLTDPDAALPSWWDAPVLYVPSAVRFARRHHALGNCADATKLCDLVVRQVDGGSASTNDALAEVRDRKVRRVRSEARRALACLSPAVLCMPLTPARFCTS